MKCQLRWAAAAPRANFRTCARHYVRVVRNFRTCAAAIAAAARRAAHCGALARVACRGPTLEPPPPGRPTPPPPPPRARPALGSAPREGWRGRSGSRMGGHRRRRRLTRGHLCPLMMAATATLPLRRPPRRRARRRRRCHAPRAARWPIVTRWSSRTWRPRLLRGGQLSPSVRLQTPVRSLRSSAS